VSAGDRSAEAPWTGAFLQVSDGALIHYQHQGHGPAVLLCDGIGCEGFAWRHLAPALAQDHHVIHPHLRGHGRSPAPPDPERVTIEILADDAIEVLEAAGGRARDAVLVGHSMGVQTCLEAYRRHPRRVRALVLMCGSYGSPLRSFLGVDIGHHLLPIVRLLLLGGRHPFRLLWRRLLPTDLAYEVALQLEVNPELIQRRDLMGYLKNLARVEPDLFLRMLTCADRHSARDLLEQVQVPVLLVAGKRDGFTPSALAHEMAGRLPDARLLEVEGGTHATPLERPDLVTDAVRSFIAEADAVCHGGATRTKLTPSFEGGR
jgi:pimeloyl-ACP methyl ester carboxylesterase